MASSIRRNGFIARFALATVLLGGCGGSGGDSAFEAAIFPLWVPTDVLAVDIDGDGRADVLTLAQLSTSSSQREGRLSIYRQTAPGVFAAPDTYVVGGYPWRMAVADIDGDGAPDIVVTDVVQSQLPEVPHALWLLLQDAAQRGRFLPPRLLGNGGSSLYKVAIGDVNGDGAPDVIVDDGLGTDATAAVLLQDPKARASFLPPRPIALPGIATDVIAGDTSGDGRTDLAFWAITSSADFIATTAMAVVRQAGNGTLAAPELSLRYTGLNVGRMAFTDYERDGLVDVFAFLTPQSTDYKARLVLARQQPPGVYTGIETSLAGVQGIDDAVIADLDGDGRPDVAVVGYWADQGNAARPRGRVNLFAPSGGGSFIPRAQYDAPDTASRIAAGDLDGDGLKDLVILAGRDQCYVMIQARATPGSFASPRALR